MRSSPSRCSAVLLDRWHSCQNALEHRKKRPHDVEGTESAAEVDGDHQERLFRLTGGNVLLHSDAERREFISAGAAAGLAVSLAGLAHGCPCMMYVSITP